MKFTAVFMPVVEGYIAFVEELPGANTQGATLDEARENLKEAVQMVLEANRDLAEKSIADKDVTREGTKGDILEGTKGDILNIDVCPGLTVGCSGRAARAAEPGR